MPCVYILTNPTIPGLLKIGFTKYSAHERAADISRGTGVPTPYVVHWFIECTSEDSAYTLEQAAHSALTTNRYNRNREFFSCTAAVAIETIQTIAHRTGAVAEPDLSVIQRLREEDAARAAAAQRAAYQRAEQERAATARRAEQERAHRAEQERIASTQRAATAEAAEKNRLFWRKAFAYGAVAVVLFGWYGWNEATENEKRRKYQETQKTKQAAEAAQKNTITNAEKAISAWFSCVAKLGLNGCNHQAEQYRYWQTKAADLGYSCTALQGCVSGGERPAAALPDMMADAVAKHQADQTTQRAEQERIAAIKATQRAEQERIAAIQASQRVEQERIAAIQASQRAEQERIAAIQAAKRAAQERIDGDNARCDAERAKAAATWGLEIDNPYVVMTCRKRI